MKDIEIINFKSPLKENYFAPEWNCFIYENFLSSINFKKLTSTILKLEKSLLNKYKSYEIKGDGYTGLGNNSLTSRYQKYNLLNIKDTEIIKIKKQIILHHNLFLKKMNLDPYPSLYIQCWANVIRKGEKINTHLHGIEPFIYLGGHICVQCENTNTYYVNPANQINDPQVYQSKNEIGKISLFQNYIPHYTDVHLSNSERITIAFDLLVDRTKIKDTYIKLY
jgi:hypothetical protein